MFVVTHGSLRFRVVLTNITLAIYVFGSYIIVSVFEKELCLMKTKEELDALKEEVKALNAKLDELSEDELKEVAGGIVVEDWQDGGSYEITLA